MADKSVIVSARQPNLRFGTSFLNTKYRTRAAEDEVLMDKSTGEIAYVRPGTGDFLYYSRENFDVEAWLLYMKTIYESNRTESYPNETNCSEIENTYMLGTQFDLDYFEFNQDSVGDPITNYARGALLFNNDNQEFNVSHEETGMFVNLHARPRDAVLINMLSKIHDETFANYSGSNSNYQAERNLLAGSDYVGKTAAINYTIRLYKDGECVTVNTKTGYCYINQPSYLPFGTSVLLRDSYDKVTLSINYVTLPKLKYAETYLQPTENEIKIKEILDDIEDVQLKSLDVFTFTTTTDTDYDLPSPSNSHLLSLMEMKTFEDAMERIAKMSKADGIICSVEAPTEDEWARISLWAERIRDVYTKGEEEHTGADSSFNDMDAFFGKAEEISGPFVLESDIYGFYVEKVGSTSYELDTNGY